MLHPSPSTTPIDSEISGGRHRMRTPEVARPVMPTWRWGPTAPQSQNGAVRTNCRLESLWGTVARARPRVMLRNMAISRNGVPRQTSCAKPLNDDVRVASTDGRALVAQRSSRGIVGQSQWRRAPTGVITRRAEGGGTNVCIREEPTGVERAQATPAVMFRIARRCQNLRHPAHHYAEKKGRAALRAWVLHSPSSSRPFGSVKAENSSLLNMPASDNAHASTINRPLGGGLVTRTS